MRGRVQRAGAPLSLGYVGAQQPRALRQAAPRHADGDRRDAEGRRDSAETRPLSRQPGVERRLRRRFRHGRARGAGIAHPESGRTRRRSARWPSRSWGRREPDEAADTYERLERISPPIAASGLGDLALYQGRLTEAVAIFERGAAADVAAKSPDRAAEKLVALAYTQLTRGDNTRAIAAAERALRGRQRGENQVPCGAHSGRGGIRRSRA